MMQFDFEAHIPSTAIWAAEKPQTFELNLECLFRLEHKPVSLYIPQTNLALIRLSSVIAMTQFILLQSIFAHIEPNTFL